MSDDLSIVKFTVELVSRLEEDATPLPEVFVKGSDVLKNGSPFRSSLSVLDVDAGLGSVRMDGDLGRDSLVEYLWAWFHFCRILVRSGHWFVNQSMDDLSDGDWADSTVRFRAGHDVGGQVGAEDLRRDIGGGVLPEGFLDAPYLVSIVCGYPFPMLVPTTSRTRGSVQRRKFIASKSCPLL